MPKKEFQSTAVTEFFGETKLNFCFCIESYDTLLSIAFYSL